MKSESSVLALSWALTILTFQLSSSMEFSPWGNATSAYCYDLGSGHQMPKEALSTCLTRVILFTVL